MIDETGGQVDQRTAEYTRRSNITHDLTIAVLVRLPDHLIHLLLGQLLSEICYMVGLTQYVINADKLLLKERPTHYVPELSSTNLTVVILVKDLESFHDLFFRIGILHLTGHHGQKLGEVDRVIAVSINLHIMHNVSR